MGKSGSEGGGAWGRRRKKAEAERAVSLTPEQMANVGWWRRFLRGEHAGEMFTAFYGMVKLPQTQTWFSDASFQAIAGLCADTGRGGGRKDRRLLRMPGALETRKGLYFQAKNVRGVENVLAHHHRCHHIELTLRVHTPHIVISCAHIEYVSLTVTVHNYHYF